MNKKDSALTLRATLVGTFGLLFITCSSMYVALKLGALPWPTVFVTILSMAALYKAKNSTIVEINCTHTLMSAGSMVAGGLAFTLPGLWMTNPKAEISLLSIISISIAGSLLGIVFTALYRRNLIEKQKLPYPIGEASYNTLMMAKNGKGSGLLFSSMGLSAVFTYLRDKLLLIPSVLTLFKGTYLVPSLSLYVSPMALAIGSMIGPILSVVWLLGMVLSYFVLVPVGIKTGLFESMAQADVFRSNLGIGIMIGTSLGVVIKAVFSISKTKKINSTLIDTKTRYLLGCATLVSLLLLVAFTEVTIVQAIIVLVGITATTYLSGMLTGQTGINPMEVFGILVLLACTSLTKTNLVSTFSIAATVAVACGLTGDVMNDIKSGSIIGTNPKDQIKAEAIGAIIGSIIASIVLFVLKDIYEFGSASFPAPQAKVVASMAGGLENPVAFYIGLAIGLVLFLIKVPSATLGLGVYLGTNISTAIGLGALVSFIATKIGKENAKQKTTLISSGLLGGEGIAGVIIAFIVMLSA